MTLRSRLPHTFTASLSFAFAVAAGFTTSACSSSSSPASTAVNDAGTSVDSAAADAGNADAGPSPNDGATGGTLIPSNFDRSKITLANLVDVDVPGTIGGDPCTLDTDQGTLTCANQTTAFGVVVSGVTQPKGGENATLFAVKSFKLDSGITLTVAGSKPAIIYSLGPVVIDGILDLKAGGSTDGPGGFHMGGPGQGSDGTANGAVETSGAGGASYCGIGGGGAPIGDGGATNAGGKAYGTPDLIPIFGGSAGGSHASSGYGGGAIQITSDASITISATGGINVNGGGGDYNSFIGGGGGSGGSILLEAPAVSVAGILSANGGGGGDTSNAGADGNFSATPAPGGGNAGGVGSGGATVNGADGTTVMMSPTNYGGGGGGAGRIRINNADGAMTGLTGTISPALTTVCGTVGKITTR